MQGGTDSNRAPVGVAGVEPAPSPYGVCQPRHSTPERGQAGISRLPSRGPGSRQGSYRVWGPDTVLLLNYLLPRLFKAKQSRPPPAPAPERRLAPCRYLHLMCPAGCSSQRCTPMPCRLPGNRGGRRPSRHVDGGPLHDSDSLLIHALHPHPAGCWAAGIPRQPGSLWGPDSSICEEPAAQLLLPVLKRPTHS